VRLQGNTIACAAHTTVQVRVDVEGDEGDR
jgi:hypothetical protein